MTYFWKLFEPSHPSRTVRAREGGGQCANCVGIGKVGHLTQLIYFQMVACCTTHCWLLDTLGRSEPCHERNPNQQFALSLRFRPRQRTVRRARCSLSPRPLHTCDCRRRKSCG